MRAFAISAAISAVALLSLTIPTAGATPPAAVPTAYLIGKCWDPSKPVEQKPATVIYGCDMTSVMENMSWTTWGANGANGTGTDNSIECQPNCAQGQHLFNPIITHAWNPMPADKQGCPDDVEFYTDFTVAYPKGVPPWVQPGKTWGDDVEYIYIDGMPAVHFFDQGPFSCTPLS